MSSLKPPTKKKHKGGNKLIVPLPIPFNNLTEKRAKSRWCYYHGVLFDDYVCINKSGDAFDLSSQGCFGKLLNRPSCKNMIVKNEEIGFSNLQEVTKQDKMNERGKDEICDKMIEICDLSDSVSDTLHLSFYESFFLSYGLGCLFIKNNENDMTVLQQWEHFCSKIPRFPLNFAAYHHFRSKGWVPKDGIRYGADFLLYSKGPPYFHASYIVVVRCVNAKSLRPVFLPGAEERHFTWETMAGLLRLATTVSKEIMFCYVAIPDDIISSTRHISLVEFKNFAIYENIVSRWVSSKEREKELLDVDCDF